MLEVDKQGTKYDSLAIPDGGGEGVRASRSIAPDGSVFKDIL